MQFSSSRARNLYYTLQGVRLISQHSNRMIPAAVMSGLGAVAGYRTARRWRNRRAARNNKTSRINKRLRRLERGSGEVKTHDVDGQFTANTTGQIIPISMIAQGDTSITREGLQIKPLSLEVKVLTTSDASSTVATTHRLIVFKDKEMHGTHPTVANILESDGLLALPEHDTRPRFKFYRDVIISAEKAAQDSIYYKTYIKFKNKTRIYYSGTTAAEASSGKNQLYLYFLTNQATNTPDSYYQIRLRYRDS